MRTDADQSTQAATADFSKEHVTIAAVPHDRAQRRDALIEKALANHAGQDVDLLVVVPKGTWRDARAQVFERFGIDRPVVPGQARRDHLDQVLAHPDNLSRMYGAL